MDVIFFNQTAIEVGVIISHSSPCVRYPTITPIFLRVIPGLLGKHAIAPTIFSEATLQDNSICITWIHKQQKRTK